MRYDRQANDTPICYEPYGIEVVAGVHLHHLVEDVAIEGEFLVVLVEGGLGSRVLLGCEILVERPQSAVLSPPLQILPRFERQFMGSPLDRYYRIVHHLEQRGSIFNSSFPRESNELT